MLPLCQGVRCVSGTREHPRQGANLPLRAVPLGKGGAAAGVGPDLFIDPREPRRDRDRGGDRRAGVAVVVHTPAPAHTDWSTPDAELQHITNRPGSMHGMRDSPGKRQGRWEREHSPVHGTKSTTGEQHGATTSGQGTSGPVPAAVRAVGGASLSACLSAGLHLSFVHTRTHFRPFVRFYCRPSRSDGGQE